MRVLVACEFSGTVRDAFARRGHEAWSCDLLPTETPGLHYTGDVRNLLDGWTPVRFTAECDPDAEGVCILTENDPGERPCLGPTMHDDGVEYREVGDELFARRVDAPSWDLLIAFPPCTYLAGSGPHWNKRRPGRASKTEEALDFVRLLMGLGDPPHGIPRVAIENPVGRISTAIRKPDQVVQPWQFGEDASKATCLWLKGLPPLVPTNVLPGGKTARRANQTPSGQNKLGPSPERQKIRSKTYAGIADAMAEQWGGAAGRVLPVQPPLWGDE